MEKLLDSASILEDQLFLLNNVQQIANCKNVKNVVSLPQNKIPNLFLSPDCVRSILDELSKFLLEQDVQNANVLGIVTRSLCSCITLLRDVHSDMSQSRVDTLNTVQDLDKVVCSIMSDWTKMSVNEVLTHCQQIINFLVCYGSLHVIPDGVHPPHFSCFWCRFHSALNDDGETNVCTHIVVEKPKIAAETDTLSTKQNGSIAKMNEDDNLSMQARLNLRGKSRDIEHTKQIIEGIHNQYETYACQQEHMTSLKELSSFLYCFVGRTVLFVCNRIRSLQFFTPSVGTMSINEAFERLQIRCPADIKMRLASALKSVSMSKTNMRIIHEQFETFHLNPLSLFCEKEAMLRPSIIAKKVAIALNKSPCTIVAEFKRRCSLIPKNVVGVVSTDLLDNIFVTVITIAAYNAWLSCQFVRKCHELQICRCDNVLPQRNTVSLLYDFGQLGFYFDDNLKVYATYDKVIDLCVIHLQSLYLKGLCQTQGTKKILE